MSQLTALKSAKTRDDVAALLQTTKQGLTAILFMKPIAARYSNFEIPKKGGGTRQIKAPDEKLKLLQHKLSLLLQNCLDEIDAAKKVEDKIVHGFKRARSIVTNAKQHRNRRWVFNIDLADFYSSIHFGRVRGAFIKDKNFLLHEDVATVLAQIACDGNALPQGSPCSPVISNLVAHTLDIHLVRLARKFGCTYTRYADDITFSTNKKEFPVQIACQEEDAPHQWHPGTALLEIIKHSNFSVNHSKTRMQYCDSRQSVTGLIVNRRINVRHEYRHTVRAMVHKLFRTGTFHVLEAITSNGVTTLRKRDGTLDELHGRLGFIDNIDQCTKKAVPDGKLAGPVTVHDAMYRQFLLYKDFYKAQRPVIICEGKTDNIYIKHAIRSLATEFPGLADKDKDGKTQLKVRLYKYTKSSTGRILGLKDGGTGNMANFIASYKKDTDKFKAPGLEQPVILLIDNDDGASAVCAAAKKARADKTAISLKDAFSHIFKNLYILATPLANGKPMSKIEDLFMIDTKDTVINGKTFSDDNKADETKHYGKWIFAEKVVAANASAVDFSGFKTLLATISLLIQTHATNIEVGPSSEDIFTDNS